MHDLGGDVDAVSAMFSGFQKHLYEQGASFRT
jgi:hypothetical protein